MQNSEKNLKEANLLATDATLRVRLTEKGAVQFNAIEEKVQEVAKKLGLPAAAPKHYQQGAAFEAPISFLCEIQDVYGENLWEDAVIAV